MADPAFATARAVDELTDEALSGLPMTDVDRVESAILADCADAERTIQRLTTQAAALKRVEVAARKVHGGPIAGRYPTHLGGCIGGLSDIHCDCGITDLSFAVMALEREA